jgi:hypothetical protein
MRQMISGLIAAMAVVTVSAVPAMACGGCPPCGQIAVSPCGQSYYGHHYYSGYHGYGYRQHLTDPDALLRPAAPRYFYANQGPTFSGPGMWAPVPTYRERAVTGWHGYDRGYYYGYNGGPYANATHHYYDGAPNWHGPAIYSYRWRHHRHHMHGMRTGIRYGHAPRHAYRHAYRGHYHPHGRRY